LLRRLTTAQLNEWLNYDQIEPLGREDLRHGQLMAMQANCNRDPKKKREPFVPADFMNYRRPLPEVVVETDQQRSEKIKALLRRPHHG